MDADGFVTEGASTNAWIVDADGTVVTTRDLSNAILPGVTRRVILEAAGRGAIAHRGAHSPSRRRLGAREAFISSATGGGPGRPPSTARWSATAGPGR